MASLLYPDDEPGLLPVPDPAAGSDGMAEVYRAITDSMERQRQQAQPTVADLGLFGPAFKYADNPVGTETTQSMGMPQPTTYAGLVGQFVDPNTGQLTEQGQARMDNPLLGFDTGGIGGVLKGFHGSPHAFDRFDNAAIGTGEGAQAYGYGHYLADSEGVARSYRDDITAKQSQRPVTINTGGPFGPVEILEQDPTKTGHMYEVNVAADPEHFLDWDKPLSEQHPVVQQAINGLADNSVRMSEHLDQARRGLMAEPTGQELYRALMWQTRALGAQAPDAVASQKLQAAGIPGIRYLDAGSRGAGEGSRNTVVFDPATMEVIRRYGIGALMAGGGAAALGGQQRQQQQ